MMTARRSTWKPALTLIETLLGIVMASLIGLAATLMLSTIANATSEQSDTRRANLRSQIFTERFSPYIRGSRTILLAVEHGVLLWVHDPNGNGLPELSELCMIEWHADLERVVVRTAAAADVDEDLVFELDSHFVDAAAILAAVSEPVILMQNVLSFEVAHDGATPQSARTVRIRVSIDCEGGPQSTTIIATPRVPL